MIRRAARSPMPATRFGAFARDRRGGVMIELAFIAPILVVILLGTFDTARYILVHQKVDRAASTMADLVTRSKTITAAEVDLLFSAAQEVAFPFDLQSRGVVIVTSVSRAEGEDVSRVDWQRTGGGSFSATSEIGTTPDEVATLPDGFTLREGDNVIAAEVFFDYEPFFINQILPPRVLRHDAYRTPRLANLSALN